MPLNATLDQLDIMVEGATPPGTAAGVTPRTPYTIVNPSGGRGRGDKLKDLNDADRFAQWVITAWPQKPPDRATARVRVGAALEIRHERTGDDRADERRIANDLITLNDRVRDSSLWDQATTGLVFIVQLGEPTTENFPDDDAPIFSITSLPFEFMTTAEGC